MSNPTSSRRRPVVQLFNGRAQSRQRDTSPGPDHLRHEHVLNETGFEVETLPVFGFPWNPAAGKHNAYQGLDPLRALRVLLTRRRAAVICAHMESALVLLLLRRLFLFRPPVIIWEVPWSPGWKFREMVAKLAIPRADRSVVFSSSQIELVHAAYGQDVPVDFIPFCLDVDFFSPRPPCETGAGYVFSCGLDAGRDFDVLLKATRGLDVPVRIKAPASFTIDPAAHPNVSLEHRNLPYPEFRTLYADAGIVVVTTKATQNASGVTSLMEALAMGRPVIVSDNPALRDYLPPPEAGIVVPVGDEAALRAAILDLLHNPAKAEAMGRKARDFALSRFSPKAHFEAMAAMFRNVIEGERSASPHRPSSDPASAGGPAQDSQS